MSQLSDGLESMSRQRLSKEGENIGDRDAPSIGALLSLFFGVPRYDITCVVSGL